LLVTSRAEQKRSVQRWALWLSLAILVTAAVIYLLVWYGPDVIARHDIGNVTGVQRTLRLQQARDSARGRLLTLGAGLFAAGALLFTGRNYGLARQTYRLTLEGQVTDRYTKAIEQLGSDKLDVRIGAVYALERIARDSATDHPTVMEVLAAFVREHSPERWPPLPPGVPEIETTRRWTRPDVQAAMTVIGRRDTQPDRQYIDLIGADLTWAKLIDADLSGAALSHANLTRARLIGARLIRAELNDANLTGADLMGANLTGALLPEAILRETLLSGAIFTGADLTDTDLTGALLGRAAVTMGGTTTIAEPADFTGADLSGAAWPEDVPVPEGWERDPSSGRLSRTHVAGDDSGN
jgi:hypothetical protein